MRGVGGSLLALCTATITNQDCAVLGYERLHRIALRKLTVGTGSGSWGRSSGDVLRLGEVLGVWRRTTAPEVGCFEYG